MTTIPHELDWVSKRAACNIGQVFDELCAGIKKDVDTINQARSLKEHSWFSANLLRDNNTIIVGQPNRVPRAVVRIGIVSDSIGVNDAITGTEWLVTVALNDEGRCILRLNDGKELEQWQFRKRALEHLFFVDQSGVIL